MMTLQCRSGKICHHDEIPFIEHSKHAKEAVLEYNLHVVRSLGDPRRSEWFSSLTYSKRCVVSVSFP